MFAINYFFYEKKKSNGWFYYAVSDEKRLIQFPKVGWRSPKKKSLQKKRKRKTPSKKEICTKEPVMGLIVKEKRKKCLLIKPHHVSKKRKITPKEKINFKTKPIKKASCVSALEQKDKNTVSKNNHSNQFKTFLSFLFLVFINHENSVE